MYRVFIVEDDDRIRDILKDNMLKYGLEAACASQFRDILPEFEACSPHLVLLDINLPFFDGYYWCRQIRKRSGVPIMFISARSGEMDQVMAIEHGGDNYITKPIQLDLMMAKVKGILRRAYGEYAAADGASSSEVTVRDLRLLLARHEFVRGERKARLTKNERLLAECFMRQHGQVVSREQLLEALWDDVHFVDDNTLSVNVTRLRRKLEELGLPKAIETVRGEGYRMDIGQAGEGEPR